MLYSLSFLLLLPSLFVAAAAGAGIRVDPTTRTFVDDHARVRVYHGMNAVYKVAPWHPQLEGFDPFNSLSDLDAKNLSSWGFNVIRLGVMWPGAEPGEKGVYNLTYLDQLESIVDTLGKNDIAVILDLHQDIWHRKFCGEGVPDWVYEACTESEPEGTQQFPLPAVNSTYPTDNNGDPELDSCLSVMFATYYMSAEVGAGFQCLYDNKHALWEAMGNFWIQVAKKFSGKSNVLGYELINEPWAGDVYEDPKRLLPGYTEKHYLQPLYEYLHTAIRTVDTEKIIFFEGLTIDYWPNAFTAGPGGAEYNDRQALAYHIYCPLQDPSLAKEQVCDRINNEFFEMRTRDAERMGVAMLMTEFGAAENIKGDIYALEDTCHLADAHQQSWMYWQFKYYNDITTCTPEGEAMFNEDGTVVESKLRVLSRTYPYATAGKIISYSFSPRTANFEMSYNPRTELNGVSDYATTDIYYNKGLYYRSGVKVDISLPENFEVICGENHVYLKQLQPLDASSSVTVKLQPCGLSLDCTCRGH